MRATWFSIIALVAIASCGEKKSDTPPTPEPAAQAEPATQPNADALPRHEQFDTPAEALRKVLEAKPRVIGFGEYHQTLGNEKIPSALTRFRSQLLAPLKEHASDLVVETWAEYGNCGEAEKQVSKNVKKDTQRPAQTESEVVALLRQAKELGMEPHYLPFDCKDYKALLDDSQQVDYEKLLLLITERLRTSATELAAKGKVVALYGGATHNDLYPDEAIADLSYATAVRDQTDGSYVEVDLYVPEFVAGDEVLAKQPWYPLLERVSTDKVLLIERNTNSYILLLRKTEVR